MKTIQNLILALGICAFFSASAYADGLHEIDIEHAWHHIGDGENFGSFVIPDAEGTYWETMFLIENSKLARARSAHLSFRILDAGNLYNSVSINGHQFALPGTSATNKQHASLISKSILSIPLGVLQPRWNTIRFEATPLFNPAPDNTHDDYEFSEVTLLLSVTSPQ